MDIRGRIFSPWTVDLIRGLSIGVSAPSVITLLASLNDGVAYAFARRAENETKLMALILKIYLSQISRLAVFGQTYPLS